MAAKQWQHDFDDLNTDQSPQFEDEDVILDPEAKAPEKDDDVDDDFDDITPGEDEEEDDKARRRSRLRKGKVQREESEEEDEEEEEDEDGSYSKRVRKRIDRERRLTERERKRREEAENRVTNLEQRFEVAWDLRNEENELRAAEQKEAEALRRLRQASEEDDANERARAEADIQEAKAAIARRKEAVAAKAGKLQELQKTTTKKANPKAEAWIDEHPEYSEDPDFQAEAKKIDQFLYGKGMDPNSDEYYREMDKHLKKKFPEAYGEDVDDEEEADDEKPEERKKRGRHPTGARTRGGHGKGSRDAGRSGRRRVRLTARDKKVMSEFGLDPSDPEDVKIFALNKAREQSK